MCTPKSYYLQAGLIDVSCFSNVSSRPHFILWNWGINLFFGFSGALTRRGGLLPDTPLLTNCQQREYMGRERDILGNLADFCYNWQCHNKVRKMNSEPVKLIALQCTLACEECEVWPISPHPPSSTTAHTCPDMYKVKGQNHRWRQFLGGSIPLSVRHKHNSCLLFAPVGSSGHQRTQWIKLLLVECNVHSPQVCDVLKNFHFWCGIEHFYYWTGMLPRLD